jgi:predicted solute-binding protein
MASVPLPVSIVGVRFLNARPLLGGLEAGLPAPFAYRFSSAEPAVCADLVTRGEAAAGLIPVAALPYLPEVGAVPRLGIACREEATSVLLISKVEPAAVRTLAAHTASRSSVTLARLLLADRWGARPRLVPAAPPLAAMLAGADAAVVIGDPALALRGRTGLLEIDLAAAWVEWTGLPFVFAVWGVRREAPAGLDTLLEGSLAYSRTHWEALLPRWAESHGVDVERTRVYLERTLTYRLGDEERAGMEEFLRRAAAAGLLPLREGVWRAA